VQKPCGPLSGLSECVSAVELRFEVEMIVKVANSLLDYVNVIAETSYAARGNNSSKLILLIPRLRLSPKL
jgi:hypothetical protein